MEEFIAQLKKAGSNEVVPITDVCVINKYEGADTVMLCGACFINAIMVCGICFNCVHDNQTK